MTSMRQGPEAFTVEIVPVFCLAVGGRDFHKAGGSGTVCAGRARRIQVILFLVVGEPTGLHDIGLRIHVVSAALYGLPAFLTGSG